MSLSNFLGKTPEITIIDFLAENMDLTYDYGEIVEYTDLSDREVTDAMEKLLYNEIIKKDLKTQKYTLKGNVVTELLVEIIYAHSFTMAEK